MEKKEVQNTKEKKKSSILFSLLAITILPVVILGGISIYSARRAVYAAASTEMQNTLSAIAHAAVDETNLVFPGEVKIENGEYYKGQELLNQDYMILDAFRQNNQVELIVYYGEESILSTFLDGDGEMIVGEETSKEIQYYVIQKEMEYASADMILQGEHYMAYIIPFAQNGALLVAKKLSVLYNHANTIAFKLVLALLICILIEAAICVGYVNNLVDVIKKIKRYLNAMATRDDSVGMHQKVLNRSDEIGEMGRYAVQVNDQLNQLINKDPLTDLFNRRAGRAAFQKLINRSDKSLAVVMGDIDHFKKINDTYGHECGDIVLKKVAETLSRNMEQRGFVIRWGGEEFLLIYEKPEQLAYDYTARILDEIRSLLFTYDDVEFQITMTFGVQGYDASMSMDEVIKLADDKLYNGKNGGRNRIIL